MSNQYERRPQNQFNPTPSSRCKALVARRNAQKIERSEKVRGNLSPLKSKVGTHPKGKEKRSNPYKTPLVRWAAAQIKNHINITKNEEESFSFSSICCSYSWSFYNHNTE